MVAKKTETNDARAFVLRVGILRADHICTTLLDADGSDYERAARIGTDAIRAAIAELEK